MVRISVDLPAPLGPSRPNMPVGMSRLMPLSACTPLAYVFERSWILRMDRFPWSRAILYAGDDVGSATVVMAACWPIHSMHGHELQYEPHATDCPSIHC